MLQQFWYKFKRIFQPRTEAGALSTRPQSSSLPFPGGGTDIVARILSEWLLHDLGQQFVIENRTGMGGSLAAQAVINAPPRRPHPAVHGPQ
jgi:tripartite-type tricarboxylate transporter receptor subunit TctC